MDRIVSCAILVAGCLLTLFLLKCFLKDDRRVKGIGLAIFVVYLSGFLYFTLLSRHIADHAVIALQPLWSYRQAFAFDYGFFHVIKTVFVQGLEVGLNAVHIQSTESLEGIILNIFLFVPLGYLLPFVWKKWRDHLPGIVGIGFAVSFATEMTQMVLRLGWFDVDDLLNNTLGTIAGVVLYRLYLYRMFSDFSD